MTSGVGLQLAQCRAVRGALPLSRLDDCRRLHVDPQQRLRALAQVVARLCRQLELPMPALTCDESEEINAGVTGTGPHDAVLYFSGGALRRLGGREAAAVAAHELAHIAAGDFDDSVAGHFVPRGARVPPLRWLLNLVRLVSWTTAKRRREYAADRLAAALVGETALIAALRKTAQDGHHAARPWFATHPHPRRRIRALQRLRRARSRNSPPPRNQSAPRAFSRQV